MKKILVPCDFSKPAEAAFKLALDIAADSKATIQLLHVVKLPVLHVPVPFPIPHYEVALLEELKEKTEQKFTQLKEKFQTKGIDVITKLEFGTPAKVILAYASAGNVDLIMMGSHGTSGLREFFIGTNAEKVVRRSPIPVFVVKDYFEGRIKNIVFPNTLETEHQADLLNKIKALQDLFQAKLHIVFINTPGNFKSDGITYARLEAFAHRYMLKEYTLNVYNHSDEEEGINQFTNRINGDLIAVGTRGHDGIGHLLNGSLAEDIANHTNKLIWTYSLKNELTPS